MKRLRHLTDLDLIYGAFWLALVAVGIVLVIASSWR